MKPQLRNRRLHMGCGEALITRLPLSLQRLTEVASRRTHLRQPKNGKDKR